MGHTPHDINTISRVVQVVQHDTEFYNTFYIIVGLQSHRGPVLVYLQALLGGAWPAAQLCWGCTLRSARATSTASQTEWSQMSCAPWQQVSVTAGVLQQLGVWGQQWRCDDEVGVFHGTLLELAFGMA